MRGVEEEKSVLSVLSAPEKSMNEIEQHPDFEPTYRRWLQVCKAAGRKGLDAEQRAHNHATHVIARQLEREQRFYEGRKHIGPDARPAPGGEAPASHSTPALGSSPVANIRPAESSAATSGASGFPQDAASSASVCGATTYDDLGGRAQGVR